MFSKKTLISLILLFNSLNANDTDIIAINQGVPKIKEMLKEVSIQKRYEKGKTLLHYAVEARDFDAVSFLVKQKITLSSQGGAYNNTPLQDAISLGYLKIAHYLIKKKTSLNLKNRYGQTALHIASSRGYKGVIKELLAYGADKLVVDNSGATPYELVPKLSHSSSKKLKKTLQVQIKKKSH